MKQTREQIPPFAQQCYDAARKPWQASFDHPFVRELASGELSVEKFKFYQMQDARYLEAYASASAIVAARCASPQDKLWFIDSARVALVTEGALHEEYGRKLGYDEASVAALEVTPFNRAYQDHIVAVAQTGSLVEAAAALSPCPWLYIDLGRSLLSELGEISDSHPYADWLRLYSDPQFETYVTELCEKLERFAAGATEAERERAVEAFVIGTRYEWMFWEQAWTMQQWLP